MPPAPESRLPPAAAGSGGTWLFGRYRLDTATRRVHMGERAREVDARALAVLECLLRRAEQVVPRTVLIEEAWPGVDTVFDSAVSKVMRRLRLALDDGQGHVLQTIYGEGYRLALPATLLPPAPVPAALPARAPPLHPSAGAAVPPMAPAHDAGTGAGARHAADGRDAASRRAWLAWLPWGIAVASTLVAGWLAWLLLQPAGA